MIDKDDKWMPIRWDMFFIWLAILACVGIAWVAKADAHVARPSMCQIAWEQAPPGQKWQAQQKCLKAVKAHNLKHLCGKPRPIIRSVKVKRVWANATQRRNLTVALNGHRRASTRHLVAMVAAIIQEDSGYNRPKGHGSSVGILQLINIHGTPKYSVNPAANIRWRMVIHNSTSWFISGVRRVDRGQSIGDLAQAQQGSAHPTLYRQWVGEARVIVARFRGPCPA